MNTPTIREMAEQHPGSVWQSLVDYANWTKNLSINRTAQRLICLSGPQFYNAVAANLLGREWIGIDSGKNFCKIANKRICSVKK